MKTSRYCATQLIALLVLAGCGGSGDQAVHSPEADAVSVSNMVAEFDRCAREGDLEAFLSHVMDDVVWMPPGEPAVVGKQAVREWYANFYGTFDIELTHDVLDTHTFGDAVIARGNAAQTLTPKAGGSPMSLSAKFILVFRRQPEGPLKVWRAIANANTPPTGG